MWEALGQEPKNMNEDPEVKVERERAEEEGKRRGGGRMRRRRGKEGGEEKREAGPQHRGEVKVLRLSQRAGRWAG